MSGKQNKMLNKISRFHTCKKCEPEKYSTSYDPGEMIPRLSDSQGCSSSSSNSSDRSSTQGASVSSCDNEKYSKDNKNRLLAVSTATKF